MRNPHDVRWSLYDSRSNAQIDALSLSQVRSMVAALSTNDIGFWSAWFEGQSEWQPLSELIGVILPPGVLKIYQAPPHPPQKFKSDMKIRSEVQPLVEFDVSLESRRETRFHKVLKVHGFSKNLNISFETETVDISLSGLRLASSIPADWEDPCILKLTDDKGRFTTIKVKLVLRQEPFRRHFHIERCENPDVFKSWLK